MPIVREWAVGQLAGIGNNDQMGQVASLLAAVRKHMIYVRDPVNAEYVISPVRLIQQIMSSGVAYGDCDDHVMLLNSALSAIGFPTKFVGVKHPPDMAKDYNHVISGVQIGPRLYLADPCSKSGTDLTYTDTLIV